MRFLAVFFLLLMTLSSCVSTPEVKYSKSDKEKFASEIFVLMNLDKAVKRSAINDSKEMLASIKPNLTKLGAPGVDIYNFSVSEAAEMFTEILSPLYRSFVVKEYVAALSGTEMLSAIEFLKTPAGRQLVKTSHEAFEEELQLFEYPFKEETKKLREEILLKHLKSWPSETLDSLKEFGDSREGSKFLTVSKKIEDRFLQQDLSHNYVGFKQELIKRVILQLKQLGYE